MEIDKDEVKWYTRKELMELLKTAERVPMRNFNPYNIREMKFMLAKFCKEQVCNDGCDSCVLLELCSNVPSYYEYVDTETLADWLLIQGTYDKKYMKQVEKLFDKRMEEGVL